MKYTQVIHIRHWILYYIGYWIRIHWDNRHFYHVWQVYNVLCVHIFMNETTNHHHHRQMKPHWVHSIRVISKHVHNNTHLRRHHTTCIKNNNIHSNWKEKNCCLGLNEDKNKSTDKCGQSSGSIEIRTEIMFGCLDIEYWIHPLEGFLIKDFLSLLSSLSRKCNFADHSIAVMFLNKRLLNELKKQTIQS